MALTRAVAWIGLNLQDLTRLRPCLSDHVEELRARRLVDVDVLSRVRRLTDVVDVFSVEDAFSLATTAPYSLK